MALPDNDAEILGTALLQARHKCDRNLTGSDVAREIGVHVKTYLTYESGTRRAPKFLRELLLNFYRSHSACSLVIESAFEQVYGKPKRQTTYDRWLAQSDADAYSEQILQQSSEILELSYQGHLSAANNLSFDCWNSLVSVIEDPVVPKDFDPEACAWLAITCARIAGHSGEFQLADRILRFGTRLWSDEVRTSMRARLHYSSLINDLRRRGVRGVTAAIKYKEELALVEELQSASKDRGMRMWQWLRYEIQRSHLVTLTHSFGKEEADYFQTIRSPSMQWLTIRDEYERTRQSAYLRILAATADPDCALAEINQVDLGSQWTGQDDVLNRGHSKVIALQRLPGGVERAIETAQRYRVQAHQWGFNLEADLFANRIDTLEQLLGIA